MPNEKNSLRVERRVPRQADRDPAGFLRRRRIVETSLAVGFPVILLALWQIAGSNGWIDRRFYPPPSDIIGEIQRTFQLRARVNAALGSRREQVDDLSAAIARLDELDAIEAINPYLYSERVSHRL